MGRECSLTRASQRKNRSQEQALPTPATKAVPARQNPKLPVREEISHSNARHGSAMTSHDACPMFQTSLGQQWLNRIWTMVLLSSESYLWLRLHQAPLWGALSNFYINKKPASYIAHIPTYLPGYMEKVNSERFYVPLVWLETLCFNTSTGSQGRNKVFSFQSAWTWHLLHEGFVVFVLSQLHFNSVQQCWKTWQIFQSV